MKKCLQYDSSIIMDSRMSEDVKNPKTNSRLSNKDNEKLETVRGQYLGKYLPSKLTFPTTICYYINSDEFNIPKQLRLQIHKVFIKGEQSHLHG